MPRLPKKGVSTKIAERKERAHRQKEQTFVQSLAESQSFLSRVSSSLLLPFCLINHYRRSRADGSAVPICTLGFTMLAAIQNPFATVPVLIKLRNCPLFYGVQMHWGFCD
jgi:hypothetical protein